MLRIISILVFFSSQAFAQGLGDFKSGAAAVSFAIENGGKSLSRPQQDNFLIYSTFMRGFLHGVQCSTLLVNGEHKHASSTPDDWMMNPAKSAPSFLAFVAKHEPENFDDDSVDTRGLQLLLLAWYMDSHSKNRGIDDTALRDVLLAQVFRPQIQKLEGRAHIAKFLISALPVDKRQATVERLMKEIEDGSQIYYESLRDQYAKKNFKGKGVGSDAEFAKALLESTKGEQGSAHQSTTTP